MKSTLGLGLNIGLGCGGYNWTLPSISWNPWVEPEEHYSLLSQTSPYADVSVTLTSATAQTVGVALNCSGTMKNGEGGTGIKLTTATNGYIYLSKCVDGIWSTVDGWEYTYVQGAVLRLVRIPYAKMVAAFYNGTLLGYKTSIYAQAIDTNTYCGWYSNDDPTGKISSGVIRSPYIEYGPDLVSSLVVPPWEIQDNPGWTVSGGVASAGSISVDPATLAYDTGGFVAGYHFIKFTVANYAQTGGDGVDVDVGSGTGTLDQSNTPYIKGNGVHYGIYNVASGSDLLFYAHPETTSCDLSNVSLKTINIP